MVLSRVTAGRTDAASRRTLAHNFSVGLCREIRVYLYDESLTSKDAMAYMIKS
jgi:hypothetical protein